ncbi:hypothetical protein HMPREF9946_03096 [Acetobacteraceae bacterium AT-5844]|nr:hypothetical protein HMPREF9946_03096 [Acetobacteraceae bacterium AT-5844]
MTLSEIIERVEVLACNEVIHFDGEAAFEAYDKARRWCRERGVSLGSMQRGAPTGLLLGDFSIAKWRNLSVAERAALDGTIEGDFRHGPVRIVILSQALRARLAMEKSA